MSIKTQIKKLEQYEVKHRSGLERGSTLLVVLATLFSLSQLTHDHTQNLKKDVIIFSNFVLNPANAERNETVRMPVKFDDGLRATATMGQ